MIWLRKLSIVSHETYVMDCLKREELLPTLARFSHFVVRPH